MGNNLERRIIVLGGTPEIIQLISEFGGEVLELTISSDYRLVATKTKRETESVSVTTSEIDLCDAILINEVPSSNLPTKSPARSDLKKILEKFHQDARPIAAIGQSLILVAELLPDRSLEVALGKDATENYRASLEKTDALLTACPADDFISDRLNKTLTALGSLSGGHPIASKTGVQRLLRELVEMA